MADPKAGYQKLKDKYPRISLFEIMLEDARMGAQNDFEEKFVADVTTKFEQFKGGMFWSDNQDTLLRRIAGPDDA